MQRSEPFLASLAQLDFTKPFRFQNLRGIDTTSGFRIQDGIDHIATTSL